MRRLLALCPIAMAFACGSGVHSGIGSCTRTSQCEPGRVCVDGACRIACADDSQCAEPNTTCCGNGICCPVSLPDCLTAYNPGQPDQDGDHLGDACDAEPARFNYGFVGVQIVSGGGDSASADNSLSTTFGELVIGAPMSSSSFRIVGSTITD